MNKELFHFMSHISENKDKFQVISILELYRWFSDVKLESVHPYVDVTFRLQLCIPLTNCSIERNFSALRRIKISFVLDFAGEVVTYVRNFTKSKQGNDCSKFEFVIKFRTLLFLIFQYI